MYVGSVQARWTRICFRSLGRGALRVKVLVSRLGRWQPEGVARAGTIRVGTVGGWR